MAGLRLLQRGSTQAAIDFTATGDNTIVAGVAGQTIRVVKMFFIVGAATNVTIKDGTGTNLTGAMPFAANGGLVLDEARDPWFTTSSGNAFVLNQSGTATIAGRIYYEQSTPR